MKYLTGAVALISLALAGCQTTSGGDDTLLSYAATDKEKVAESGNDTQDHPYSSLIRKYAKANGVPYALANAVVFSESSYNRNARGSAGEIGLMQLKLQTARGVGYGGSSKGLYDPETNLKYGMVYLGQAYKLAGGTTCGTILRYNAGHGAVSMNPISQAYCNKVSSLID